ncbi:MAG: hypothetical protein A4S09_00580 [Proteobacteria bacterium SG_bin7]|nr:MAG: hypothetical protein A4S09_00580 [Proteobacteria bacterium SG_bin7]
MLDEVRSKSGHRVLRCAGRLLASREDPIREANRWLENNRKYFSGRKCVIVLGVGCAYHLELLAQQASVENVVGIDCSDEIISWCRERLQSKNKGIIFFSIKEISRVKIYLSGSYAVLKYFPSIVTNQKIFKEQYEFLLGRTTAGAQFISSSRESFKDIDWRQANEPISANSILALTDDPYWKALGELIV